MHFAGFHTDSGTGTCANIYGSQKNSNHWHVPVVAGVLKPV